MASRLDACCSRIETAVRMNQVSTGMKGVVKGMDKSLASMNIEQLSKVMDKFESQFEDLDVKVRWERERETHHGLTTIIVENASHTTYPASCVCRWFVPRL